VPDKIDGLNSSSGFDFANIKIMIDLKFYCQRHRFELVPIWL